MGPAGCWRLAREGYCLLEQNCIYEHSKFPTENKSNPPKSTFSKCHFCQKHEHKLPIYCPVIPKMDYSTIKAIIKAHEITCNMCFGTDHKTLACIATCEGKLNKCSIQTKSGSICNKLHNKNIHRENSESVILITILCRPSLAPFPFSFGDKKDK